MTTIDAERLLRTLTRDLWISTAIRGALGVLLAAGLVAALRTHDADVRSAWLWTATMTVAVVWSLLSVFSMRQMRAVAQASLFLAHGRLDQTERRLLDALRSFSIHRGAKLTACHNLAVLAHGRGEFAAAAHLCEGVLRRIPRRPTPAHRMTRILLADCRLALNDANAADAARNGLDALDAGLPLSERMMLLPVQIQCEQLVRGPETAIDRLTEKVRLAELLESPRAALVHAMLAAACRALNRAAQATYFSARAALYHDLDELYQRFPSLKP